MSATAQRDVPTSTGEVAVQRSEGSAMSKSSFPWHARPGLAGGIDKDGTRGAELLGLGFGSVEFGTVAVGPRIVEIQSASSWAFDTVAERQTRRTAGSRWIMTSSHTGPR